MDNATLLNIRRGNRAPVVLLLLGAAIASLVFAVFLTWRISISRAEWGELQTAGITATASVTGRNCANHGAVTYSWQWQGQRLSAMGHSCTEYCERLPLGATQEIRFLPAKPWLLACAGTTATTSSPSYAEAFWVAVLAMAVLVGLYRRLRPSFS